MASEVEREEFRAAIGRRDPDAWAALWARYHDLLRAWIRRDPALAFAGEEAEDLTAWAFARFWRACKPTTVAEEWEVGAYLAYLRLCASSVVRDAARRRRRRPDVPLSGSVAEGGAPLEERVARQMAAGELWRWAWAATKDEAERAVLRGLRDDLRPREICAGRPDVFPNRTSYHRARRNLVERLRHAAAREVA